tara:strand:+ start:231 stop:734 length:504 start_codon:yes stop_codon:yes gene_type:complete
VKKKIERNYLEINSLNQLNDSKNHPKNFNIHLVKPTDFQLNKFFYKNIGKNHHWVDRLIWTENQWIEYTSSKEVETYVLKNNNDLAGFFEIISHSKENEVEIAYLGLLKEYQNQNLGSFLLSSAIKISFLKNPQRVWVHTCSLDHKNALNNYISRGMKVFKKETITI